MTESSDSSDPMRAGVHMQWGVKIPLRDGIHLNATVYTPKNVHTVTPCIMTLTPYTGQSWHRFAVYFAAHGYPFLAVDSRGRGNSEGEFRPFMQEANDGYDVVEWVARQPYCNGKVAMWGGSYGGYDQWATAAQCPPHLATIVPVASVYPGVDFPMRNNLGSPYVLRWLAFVSGRTAQDRIFLDQAFWNTRFMESFESGVPFKKLDVALGNSSRTFQEWLSHPQRGAYWDHCNPTSVQLAKLSIPILTITGVYDADQPGALTHYREHLENASADGRARHFLIIGPWDHAGTREPKMEFGGLKVGCASLVDLPKLHVQWYAWTMRGGPKPEFMQKNVVYYVMGAEKWRYADTLEAVTARSELLYLQSGVNPTDVFQSGSLVRKVPIDSQPDRYVYDPRDIDHAKIESTVEFYNNWTDQRLVHMAAGKQLVYHSAPFDADTEISGFFRFTAWLSIDQPDTDMRVSIYAIDLDGSSILLSDDWMRARYRESLRQQKLIETTAPQLYAFERFTFVSRQVKRRSRLRLVIGPINSIHVQKNYNSGGVVAEESGQDARSVTVMLHHDQMYPSVLHVPFGQPESAGECVAPVSSLVDL
jgi:uncharacterized protein